MATMTYKEAITKLSAANRPIIIDNDDIILLKVDGCYNLVRNDNEALVQTRYKTVNSIQELEDDWMDTDAAVDYEYFEDEDKAAFMFDLLVIVATHRDITL